MSEKPIEQRVAEAIVKHSWRAGQACSETEPQAAGERAENLLREGYIVAGDPKEWGSGGAVATVLMEASGGDGDCEVPLDYYGDADDVSCLASDELGDHHISFVNAGVAVVYPS